MARTLARGPCRPDRRPARHDLPARPRSRRIPVRPGDGPDARDRRLRLDPLPGSPARQEAGGDQLAAGRQCTTDLVARSAPDLGLSHPVAPGRHAGRGGPGLGRGALLRTRDRAGRWRHPRGQPAAFGRGRHREDRCGAMRGDHPGHGGLRPHLRHRPRGRAPRRLARQALVLARPGLGHPGQGADRTAGRPALRPDPVAMGPQGGLGAKPRLGLGPDPGRRHRRALGGGDHGEDRRRLLGRLDRRRHGLQDGQGRRRPRRATRPAHPSGPAFDVSGRRPSARGAGRRLESPRRAGRALRGGLASSGLADVRGRPHQAAALHPARLWRAGLARRRRADPADWTA